MLVLENEQRMDSMRPQLVIQSRRDSAVRVSAICCKGPRIQNATDASETVSGVAAISPPKPCPAATPHPLNSPRSKTRPGMTLGVAAISPPKPCPAATPHFSNTPRSKTRPGMTQGVAAISPPKPCPAATPHFSNTPRSTLDGA